LRAAGLCGALPLGRITQPGANSQAVEHFEMFRYGTLIAWTEELGHDDVVRLLMTNLNKEKAANTKLNTIAVRKGVNEKASAA
jgi:ferritin-like metal-binding protein YciE